MILGSALRKALRERLKPLVEREVAEDNRPIVALALPSEHPRQQGSS